MLVEKAMLQMGKTYLLRNPAESAKFAGEASRFVPGSPLVWKPASALAPNVTS